MKRFCLLLLFILAITSIQSQNIMEVKNKAFYWGVKIGCSSSFPVLNELKINDTEIIDYHIHYKVGWQTAVFGRFNIKRFYIQPSIVWRKTSSDIRFQLEEEQSCPEPIDNQIKQKTNTIEVPVMAGFYLVKEGPYALSISVGPSFKYNYKNRYKTLILQSANEYNSDSTPFNLNIATGVSVSIGRLFLDFNYEFGLNQSESKLISVNKNSEDYTSLKMDKRTNLLSFSLGLLF